VIYRRGIQILRGISVVYVIIFHLKIVFFSKGFLGVDIFFVISGFLMAALYERKGQGKSQVFEFFKFILGNINDKLYKERNKRSKCYGTALYPMV
jgi:peptidoglycan/LPS O-acetylase OafA/YrhL